MSTPVIHENTKYINVIVWHSHINSTVTIKMHYRNHISAEKLKQIITCDAN